MSTESRSAQPSTLSELLASPSPESWAAIVEMGSRLKRFASGKTKDCLTEAGWAEYQLQVVAAVKSWPPEIERLCPSGWPREFREVVEHRVLETDTYGHYVAKICGDPALRLSDGSQAVWLERRFTGGIVPVSIVQQATRLLSAAEKDVRDGKDRADVVVFRQIQNARNLLANGVRNVGKVGCADLTGGLVVEAFEWRCDMCGHKAEEGPNPKRQGVVKFRHSSCGVFEHQKTERHEYRLEVEIKVGKQPQDPAQVLRMNHVRSRGGCYVLAHSVDEAVAGIVQFRDSKS